MLIVVVVDSSSGLRRGLVTTIAGEVTFSDLQDRELRGAMDSTAGLRGRAASLDIYIGFEGMWLSRKS
jgi:hypothetical protein